jgi:prevent-host-death family protein
MRTIPAGEFKAKCLALMDEVCASGETILITKRGKPVAQLSSATKATDTKQESIFGFMRDMATIAGDIVESEFSDAEWERMEDEKFSIHSDKKPA